VNLLVDVIICGASRLNGAIKAPPSKSLTHRALIASTLSDGTSVIKNPLICDDTIATLNACHMIGANIKKKDDSLEVRGCSRLRTPEDVIDCRDSASTMRFMTPICALADGISILTGRKSLRRRPMKPLLDAMRSLGVKCYSARGDGYPPVIVFGGGLNGGRASIRGDISSQFISGLLFSSPMAQKDTEIDVTTRLESKPYIEATMNVLRRHGVEIKASRDYRTFQIPCRQKYEPSNHIIEGDYSSAAFILAAAAVTDSKVKVRNLKGDSIQGDRAFVDILKEAGVYVKVGKDFVEVEGSSDLKPFNIDLKDNPDLVPACAAIACFIRGKSIIRGVKRLRFKESNRISSLLSEFAKIGAKISSVDNAITIKGGEEIRGADLHSHNDHRIAMACMVVALGAEGKSIVRGIECINKSYPNFLRDITSLGAEIIER